MGGLGLHIPDQSESSRALPGTFRAKPTICRAKSQTSQANAGISRTKSLIQNNQRRRTKIPVHNPIAFLFFVWGSVFLLGGPDHPAGAPW